MTSTTARTLTCALTLTVALVAPGMAAATPGDDTVSPFIVGGVEITDPAQNPGAVFLTTADRPLVCSGSRLSSKWVLTARHCIDRQMGGMPAAQLLAYTNHLGGKQGVFAKVVRGEAAPVGDLAVVELATETEGKVLGWNDQKAAVGEATKVYGWGKTANSEPLSKTLKMGEGKITDLAGRGAYRGPHYIVKGVTGAPLNGDSGGALVGAGGQAIGVVSGAADSNGGTPTHAVSFGMCSENAEWIKKTTGVQPNVKPYYLNADGTRMELG